MVNHPFVRCFGAVLASHRRARRAAPFCVSFTHGAALLPRCAVAALRCTAVAPVPCSVAPADGRAGAAPRGMASVLWCGVAIALRCRRTAMYCRCPRRMASVAQLPAKAGRNPFVPCFGSVLASHRRARRRRTFLCGMQGEFASPRRRHAPHCSLCAAACEGGRNPGGCRAALYTRVLCGPCLRLAPGLAPADAAVPSRRRGPRRAPVLTPSTLREVRPNCAFGDPVIKTWLTPHRLCVEP
jgi:hypothetical protein